MACARTPEPLLHQEREETSNSKAPSALCTPSFLPHRQLPISSSLCVGLHFLDFYVQGITQDEPFCTFTRRDGFKRHDRSCVPWHRRTGFCVLLPVDGHLGCLQVLVTTHKAAVGVQARVSLQRVRISPGEYRSGAAEGQAACPRCHRAYTTVTHQSEAPVPACPQLADLMGVVGAHLPFQSVFP